MSIGKNNKILLSVIVPVYNAEKYIERCINSIINQSVDNIEIIIVNDGSLDNTKNILKKYSSCVLQSKTIKIIDIENNGVSNARNIGIEAAVGDYITFVDADDWIDIDLYKETLKFIIENKCDMLRYGFRIIYPKHKKENKKLCKKQKIILKRDYKEKLYKEHLKGYDLANVFCMIYKRDLIKNVKFNNEISYGEDFLFNIDVILQSESIGFLNSCNKYNYYIDENSCSRIRNEKKLISNLQDAKRVYYNFYNKMKDLGMQQDFLEYLELRYLKELEIIIKKLTTSSSYHRIDEILKSELYGEEFFVRVINKYKKSSKIYDLNVFILYKMGLKVYYNIEKKVEKIKMFIKQLMF